MRIISGILKGKKLSFLNLPNTRPLKDIVKESIFNIIAHSNLIQIKIQDSEILDMYSGVGSFGIECISRGAKNVTFVEDNKNTLRILNENIKKLSIEKKVFLFPKKTDLFLSHTKKNKFDIIFFDPPFADEKFKEELRLIKNLKLFKKEHLIIIHRERKNQENLENLMKIQLVKNYGRSKVIFGVI